MRAMEAMHVRRDMETVSKANQVIYRICMAIQSEFESQPEMAYSSFRKLLSIQSSHIVAPTMTLMDILISNLSDEHPMTEGAMQILTMKTLEYIFLSDNEQGDF